ncbi:tetratricopeptide repeat-containing sensor histidine kinase [Roseivirga pacifica]|uniref:tetratricopeptide repeat-containing sensor histidine kinase n=1 Tax=Roseivirga pacifica TaxID=1267423 RepID=UPI003BB03C68
MSRLPALLFFLSCLIISIHVSAQDLINAEEREAAHFERLYNAQFVIDVSPDSALQRYLDLEIFYNEFSDSLKMRYLIDREFTYFRLGMFDECIDDLVEALAISERNDLKYAEEVYLGFGHLYYAVDSMDLALPSYRKAISLAKASLDTGTLIPTYDGIANTFQELENYDSAKHYFLQGIDLSFASGDTMNLTNLEANYATLLYDLGEVKDAIRYQESVLTIEKIKGDSVDFIFSHANLGRYYYDLDPEKSQRHIDTAFSLAHNMELVDYQRELNFGFSEIAEYHGEYEKALKYYKAYDEIEKRQLNQDMMDRLKGWEITLDNQQKDAEITLLQEVNAYETRQKRMLWFGVGSLSIVLCLVAWLAMQLQKNKKQLSSQNEELSALNETKDKFFSIIAHDLRSPMIALQGVGQKLGYFIRKEKFEKLLEVGGKIDQSIDQLNHLLNNLLNWATSQNQSIPYHPEVLNAKVLVEENMELYKSLAEAKQVNFENGIEDASIYADVNTAATVFRNVLSNALKFSPENGTISISSEHKGQNVLIKVIDQGQGMSPEQVAALFSRSSKSNVGTRGEKGFGLGLKLCQEFMDLNKGSLQVYSKLGEGTCVELSFPKAG